MVPTGQYIRNIWTPSELIFQCYPLKYMDHHYTEVNCNRKVNHGTIF